MDKNLKFVFLIVYLCLIQVLHTIYFKYKKNQNKYVDLGYKKKNKCMKEKSMLIFLGSLVTQTWNYESKGFEMCFIFLMLHASLIMTEKIITCVFYFLDDT